MKSQIKRLSPGYVAKKLSEFQYSIKSIAYLNAPRSKKSPTEIRGYFKLLIFMSGRAEVILKGSKYYVGNGDCVIFPPGSLYNATVTNDGPCQFLGMEFSLDTPLQTQEFIDLVGLKEIGIYANVISESETEKALEYFPVIEMNGDKSYHNSVIFLQQVIGDVVFRDDSMRTRLVSEKTNDAKYEEIIMKCYKYVLDNKSVNVTVQSLCNLCGVSRSFLYACFTENIRLSPKDFIIKNKMQMAEQDLMQTDKSIAEISVENGYANPYQFSLIFKNTFGVSPSVHRKNMKNL